MSAQASQAGTIKKKKNRVKGKHAKGPDGKPLCGVESKSVHFSKSPTCATCKAGLETKPSKSAAAAKKRGKRKPKAVTWVVAACPVCEAPIPEPRMDRHMRKIHSGVGRRPPPD